ncbi:MAG TPA: hypothetical protein PKO15_11130 [Fibrobacteria bacterium]|nr:hypothetical protein [Fibrobacteria bacterium]
MRTFPALAAFLSLVSAVAGASDVDTGTQNRIMPVPVMPPKVEFVVIHTATVDWLQAEFSGLSAVGVRIDSVSVSSYDSTYGSWRANLEVHWRWAERGRDTLYPNARRMQFLRALPFPPAIDNPPRARAGLFVDSIWTCQNGRCQIAPPPRMVHNFETRFLFCAVACVDEDSATLVAKVRDRIRTSGLALAFRPSASTPQGVWTGWTSTTGAEELRDLSVPLAGNVANWVTRRVARFDIAPLAYPAATKPAIPSAFEYSEGPAEYMYHRTANPNLKILEDLDERVVGDTLVKFGKSLRLTGNPRVLCTQPVNDTDAIKDSWLVVPDSTSATSIDRALTPVFCGLRGSAWRMSGDSVWLAKNRWPIHVSDLLGLSSRRPLLTETGKPLSVGLIGDRLELPWSAMVVLRDLSGRRLGAIQNFESGVHALGPAGHRGTFLVEIRSLDGKVFQVLKGNTLAR